MADKKQLLLRAFLRKCFDSYLLKAIIRDSGAHLSRKGRSRDWILIADAQQMQSIVSQIEQAQQPSWQWLVKLLKEQRMQLTHNELVNLVKRNPAISTNQLIGLTDCTLAQARAALDEVEWAE
ncbi:ribosome recycling factor family protein [Psychrobium sp. 1_MG-2023]|uniref:ribosome recycling factor family protein n=1 Tax=Psychrobium sp. 1_MG-2023 TaxID=3062624 RepID=UPI0026C5351C|nr:ribosome recycling factor family protein [Psychrobium sp. 1_MG-2023]MDP2559888.1 ribosome recycling factor family protein [Psychrobium sp. 1_MG-2023]